MGLVLFVWRKPSWPLCLVDEFVNESAKMAAPYRMRLCCAGDILEIAYNETELDSIPCSPSIRTRLSPHADELLLLFLDAALFIFGPAAILSW